jgi:hypothetical protein
MPELNNDAPDTAVPDTAVPDAAVPDSALPGAAWPELTVPGSRAAEADVADPAVLAILDRVREVPGLPVSEHPAAYADMHDALLEALNEEPQNEEPREEPQHGPGAA